MSKVTYEIEVRVGNEYIPLQEGMTMVTDYSQQPIVLTVAHITSLKRQVFWTHNLRENARIVDWIQTRGRIEVSPDCYGAISVRSREHYVERDAVRTALARLSAGEDLRCVVHDYVKEIDAGYEPDSPPAVYNQLNLVLLLAAERGNREGVLEMLRAEF